MYRGKRVFGPIRIQHMKIVSIRSRGGRVPRDRLRLEDGSELVVAREIVLREGLRAGDHLPDGAVDELLREDLGWRARDAALRLLAHRPRTESELRTRLERKGFPADVIAGCLSPLREKGLVNDTVFAGMFTRDRIRFRPSGRRRVVQELRSRGVEAASAEEAVKQAMGDAEVDDLALARVAAEKWRPRPGEERERARRRLAAFLSRRGFGSEEVWQVVGEVVADD